MLQVVKIMKYSSTPLEDGLLYQGTFLCLEDKTPEVRFKHIFS